MPCTKTRGDIYARQGQPSPYGPNSIGEQVTEVNWALAKWRKSQRSEVNGCVEVARTEDLVAMRHSRDADGHILVFHADEWYAFVDALKRGDFDLPQTWRTTSPR